MDEPDKNHGIKNWPKSERPRELLLEQGPEYVSDAGLVAILLRTGVKGQDAVALGRELIKQFSGLGELLSAGKKDLEKIKGLGPAKIAQLLAATEIAKRQLKEEDNLTYSINSGFQLGALFLYYFPSSLNCITGGGKRYSKLLNYLRSSPWFGDGRPIKVSDLCALACCMEKTAGCPDNHAVGLFFVYTVL